MTRLGCAVEAQASIALSGASSHWMFDILELDKIDEFDGSLHTVTAVRINHAVPSFTR